MIDFVATAKAAFTTYNDDGTVQGLKWKDEGDPRIAFAVCGLDRRTEDNTIFLAMEK